MVIPMFPKFLNVIFLCGEFTGNIVYSLYLAIPSDPDLILWPEITVHFPKMSSLAACTGCMFRHMQKYFITISSN